MTISCRCSAMEAIFWFVALCALLLSVSLWPISKIGQAITMLAIVFWLGFLIYKRYFASTRMVSMQHIKEDLWQLTTAHGLKIEVSLEKSSTAFAFVMFFIFRDKSLVKKHVIILPVTNVCRDTWSKLHLLMTK